jgi:hypothetical protein
MGNTPRGEFGMANGDFLEALNAPQIAFSYPERIGSVDTKTRTICASGHSAHGQIFLILLVDEDNARLKDGRFNVVEIRVGNDNDLVTHHRETCGSAVETDNTGARRSFYHVSREARASVDIVDVDTLIDEEASGLDEDSIDRNRTLIVQICLRNARTVDLAFHQGHLHRKYPVLRTSDLLVIALRRPHPQVNAQAALKIRRRGMASWRQRTCQPRLLAESDRKFSTQPQPQQNRSSSRISKGKFHSLRPDAGR